MTPVDARTFETFDEPVLLLANCLRNILHRCNWNDHYIIFHNGKFASSKLVIFQFCEIAFCGLLTSTLAVIRNIHRISNGPSKINEFRARQ